MPYVRPKPLRDIVLGEIRWVLINQILNLMTLSVMTAPLIHLLPSSGLDSRWREVILRLIGTDSRDDIFNS